MGLRRRGRTVCGLVGKPRQLTCARHRCRAPFCIPLPTPPAHHPAHTPARRRAQATPPPPAARRTCSCWRGTATAAKTYWCDTAAGSATVRRVALPPGRQTRRVRGLCHCGKPPWNCPPCLPPHISPTQLHEFGHAVMDLGLHGSPLRVRWEVTAGPARAGAWLPGRAAVHALLWACQGWPSSRRFLPRFAFRIADRYHCGIQSSTSTAKAAAPGRRQQRSQRGSRRSSSTAAAAANSSCCSRHSSTSSTSSRRGVGRLRSRLLHDGK